jgi:signal peptidase II
LSETSPESHADTTDLVAPVPQQSEPEVEPPVEGDRLGVPAGATAVIADYGRPRPSYVFLALVSILTLAADLASKAWAEQHLDGSTVAEIWKNHVTLLLAKNRGGAWGLLQSTSENVRRPFFLLVSVAAIAFIMTLYRRPQGHQRALKWGLPLVLGGALGNVFDRIRYGHVIDFIDYRADWMRKMNEVLLHNSNDHWPTFNIADVAICVGVGLMAIDMFTSKRGRRPLRFAPLVPPAQSGEISVDWKGAPASLDAAGVDLVPAPVAAEGPVATVAPDELPHVPVPPADAPPRE